MHGALSLAAALAATLAASGAQAAHVVDWPDPGPSGQTVFVSYAEDGGPVDEVYSVDAVLGQLHVETTALANALPGATMTLYSGIYGQSPAVRITSFDALNVDDGGLTVDMPGPERPGFYLEIQAPAALAGTAWEFSAATQPWVPPEPVPEPPASTLAAAALLLLSGVAARKRSRG
jgi:hypothetical protein